MSHYDLCVHQYVYILPFPVLPFHSLPAPPRLGGRMVVTGQTAQLIKAVSVHLEQKLEVVAEAGLGLLWNTERVFKNVYDVAEEGKKGVG